MTQNREGLLKQKDVLKGIIKSLEDWALDTKVVNSAGKETIIQNLQSIISIIDTAYPK